MDKIKDLGIVFDYRLKFDEHVDEKINKAYQMLGIIKRNFIHKMSVCPTSVIHRQDKRDTGDTT